MFKLIANAFFFPFKSAILEAYQAAKESAFADIKAGLPVDRDMAEARAELEKLSRPALPAPRRRKAGV